MPIDRRLRIALVCLHTSPADLPGSGDAGGMNVVVRAHADELAALGHEVELITRRSDPDQRDVVPLGDRVTLRHLDAGPPEHVAKSAQEAFIDEFGRRLGQLEPYDLIHSHHWMSGVAALPVARAWRVPHVQSYHSVAAPEHTPLADGERPESAGRIAGEALVARASDLIVSVSEYEASVVIERCGADPGRVEVVLPGVDPDRFRPLRPGERPGGALPIPDAAGRGYLAFAARLQPLKAPDLAIAALALIDPAVRPRLVIAGEPSADFAAYRTELDTMITAGGVGDDVTFLGPQPRDELAVLLRGARVVLMPSHSETFGLIALEGAASGVPVVASAAGGLRELVVDGVTGRLLADRRPEAWAATLTEFLTDSALHQRTARAARKHAITFSWGRAARRLDGLYTGLVQRAAA